MSSSNHGDSTSSDAMSTDAGESALEDPAGPKKYMSIGEVLNQLEGEFHDISISKIRFLETRGLVEPHRAPSGYRKFVGADVDRLRWILTMQRDHFLPLRVIKERLDSGENLDGSGADQVTETTALAETAQAAPRAKKTSRFAVADDSDDLSPADLARLAGLSAPQLDQLLRFGLIEPRKSDDGSRFSRDELDVAKAAAAFLQHGIEARHLKAWRVAAEREAGMLEQIVLPMSRKGSGPAGERAREVADELVEMGNVIREAIIVKSLRSRLDFGTD